MKDLHTVLYGKEACRQTGKWNFEVRPSKEEALEAACAHLRRPETTRSSDIGVLRL
jgi:hypothetical protein